MVHFMGHAPGKSIVVLIPLCKMVKDGDVIQGDCPSKILELMRASDGFSVWQVHGRDEIVRTVAATSLLRSKIEDVVYVVLEESSLYSMGIRLQPSNGTTIDAEINKNHRELINITGSRFIQLARLIRDSNPDTVGRDEILDSAKQNFNAGKFNRDRFAAKSYAGFDILLDWFRRRVIDFV